MPKLNVSVNSKKYSDGRIDQLNVDFGKKSKIAIQYIYDENKQLRDFVLEGSKVESLSLSDLTSLIRLANAQIQKEPVTLDTIKSYTPPPIINGGFEHDFVGWTNVGCTISTTVVARGLKSCKFNGFPASYLHQDVPNIWLKFVRAISFKMYTDNIGNCIQASVTTDKGVKLTKVYCSAVNTWEEHEIAFDSESTLQIMAFVPFPDVTPNTWIDDVRFFFYESELSDSTLLSPCPFHQHDATLAQANPVQNTWYTVLDTTQNVRLISIWVQIEDVDESVQVRITIDGITLIGVSPLVADSQDFVNLSYAGTDALTIASTVGYLYKAFFLEGRSVKVEIRKITNAGNGDLNCLVKWAKFVES
jgi:hypothetical protein